jgi:hypothetical protein
MPRFRLAALSRTAAAAGALVLALSLTACAGEDDAGAAPTVSATTTPPGAQPTTAEPTPTPTPDDAQTISVTFAGGEVNPAPGIVDVPRGTRLRITVTSDVVDELHVHGYDKTLQLPAGQSAELEFVADLPGRWEVELHKARKVLTRLQVQ